MNFIKRAFFSVKARKGSGSRDLNRSIQVIVHKKQDSGNGVVFGSPPGFTEPDIAMDGVLHGELLTSFKDGTNKIVEGRQITKEDADKQVVIIEKHLAKKNNLKVGSKVKVKSEDVKASSEFEVVGIYKTSGSSQMPTIDPYNKMYVPYKASLKLTPKFVETLNFNHNSPDWQYVSNEFLVATQ